MSHYIKACVTEQHVQHSSDFHYTTLHMLTFTLNQRATDTGPLIKAAIVPTQGVLFPSVLSPATPEND